MNYQFDFKSEFQNWDLRFDTSFTKILNIPPLSGSKSEKNKATRSRQSVWKTLDVNIFASEPDKKHVIKILSLKIFLNTKNNQKM